LATLAVISLNREEHRRLLEVWKFYPFLLDLHYHYLYTGPDSSSDLPEHTGFASQAFTVKHSGGINLIRDYLVEKGIERICFASLESFALWANLQDIKYLTLYTAKNHTLADLRGCAELSSEELAALLNAAKIHPALLQSEAALSGSNKDAVIYPDYQSWLQNGSGETLLSANPDLLSAICSTNLEHYRISHIWSGGEAANLALGGDGDSYVHTLNRLSQFERQALPVLAGQSACVPAYTLFAEYYDSYMSHVNYEEWLDLMLSWYRRFSRTPLKRVLEVACGTANAAELLVFRGYEVDACDSSPSMLHIADGKVFKPRLFRASLTDPLPHKDYDFIFCLFDSINYLTHRSEIRALIKHAKAALRPGGIFVFDISTLGNSLQNFNDSTTFTRVRDGYLVHVSNYEILSNRQLTHFTLFRKNGANYDKYEERHVQRVYRSDELVDLLAGSELHLKAIFAPETHANLLNKAGSGIDERYYRLFFLLQKEG
jgi:SAM-dependent methyltransferase